MSSDGWKTVEVRPVPGGGLTWAETKFDGPYGVVETKWRVDGGRFTLEVQVPPNSRAIIVFPGQSKDSSEETDVGSGWHTFDISFQAEEWPPLGNITKYSGPLSRPCDCF